MISALICTRDRPEMLLRAAKSVLADPGLGELIVVDQSRDERSRAALERLGDGRLRFVKSTRQGKGAALNEGLGLARGEILACTDDDCVAPEGWASAMGRALEENPKAVLAFCSVIPAPYDASRGYIPTYDAERGRELSSIVATCAGHGLGAGMAVRRGAILEMGGFDESVGPGSRFPSGDDWDLEHRALLRGYRVLELRNLAVVHYGFRTFEDGRAHALRDWIAIGAVCAKPIRAGHLSAAVVPFWEFTAHALLPPLLDLLRLRRPRGLARLRGFAQGFWRGLLTPVDRKTMRFVEPPEGGPSA